MGTPDFALFSLKKLYECGHEIAAVITQPDKPTGRGYVMTPPIVKRWALEKDLTVYQPKTLRDEEFASLLSEIDPELIVVVAFGKILPENVIKYPKYGCINVHGSLLPEYRGAAPMQRAIIDGKKTTGITTMYMDVGLDTGDMLLKTEVEILPDDNFESIHDKLGEAGALLLIETVKGLEAGTITPEKQNDALSTYAKKIEKSDCLINFAENANTVHNLIRGLSPIPLSFTHTPNGKLLKVVASQVADEDSENSEEPGTVVALDGRITVACGKGKIDLLTVVPEGKSRMSAADFIRGRKINIGDVLK
jgi:methionyl-tRNA formyltransferase